jgi:hypothetical protein
MYEVSKDLPVSKDMPNGYSERGERKRQGRREIQAAILHQLLDLFGN